MAEKKTTKKTTKTAAKKESTKAVKAVKASKKAATPKKEENPVESAQNEKMRIISEYSVKDGDTGSPEVQIALLTSRISKLASHLETNKKDNHSRRGLLGIISKRRRLLLYLQGIDETRYKTLIGKLGIKK